MRLSREKSSIASPHVRKEKGATLTLAVGVGKSNTMPRQLLLEYPGAIYHVMNRGDSARTHLQLELRGMARETHERGNGLGESAGRPEPSIARAGCLSFAFPSFREFGGSHSGNRVQGGSRPPHRFLLTPGQAWELHGERFHGLCKPRFVPLHQNRFPADSVLPQMGKGHL